MGPGPGPGPRSPWGPGPSVSKGNPQEKQHPEKTTVWVPENVLETFSKKMTLGLNGPWAKTGPGPNGEGVELETKRQMGLETSARDWKLSRQRDWKVLGGQPAGIGNYAGWDWKLARGIGN